MRGPAIIGRCDRAITRELGEHRKYRDKWYSWITVHVREDAEGEFLNGSLAAVVHLSTSLMQLASTYANRGVLDSVDQSSANWADVDRAVLYWYWYVKLEATFFFRRTGSEPGPLDLEFVAAPCACLLAYSPLHGLESWERYTNDSLTAMVTTRGALTDGYWAERIFEPFMLLLRQKFRSEPIPEEVAVGDLGPYANVLAHWDDGQLTADDMLAICDYHCEHMGARGGYRMEEFDKWPFDLYPVEILAIYAVRDRLGLSTPKVDHPLLATPLGALTPRQPVLANDDILSRVESLYREYFG